VALPALLDYHRDPGVAAMRRPGEPRAGWRALILRLLVLALLLAIVVALLIAILASR